MERFERTELVLGSNNMKILKESHVAVFGAGGVGGYTIEALARSGIGNIDIFDNDTVSLNNINRQIIATTSTVGRLKTEVFRERLLDINPKLNINTYDVFYLPENAENYDLSKYNYIVDAIDTVTAKLELIMRAKKLNIPIISCMGTGNKLEPSKLMISDIYKTSMCPLAKVMRKELKKRDCKRLKVLFSIEQPKNNNLKVVNEESSSRNIPGSISFVPSCAGLIIASEVIKDLCKDGFV